MRGVRPVYFSLFTRGNTDAPVSVKRVKQVYNCIHTLHFADIG